MQLGFHKEAILYLSEVVRVRPRNNMGWEVFIRCLYQSDFIDEALEQTEAALVMTGQKPVFLFYKAFLLLAAGKSKEALLQLENVMSVSPKLLKKFVELNPAILQNQQVVDVIAKYKRNKSI